MAPVSRPLEAFGVEAARATPGAVGGTVRFWPEMQDRARRGGVDLLADFMKLSPRERKVAQLASEAALRAVGMVLPAMAPGAAAEQGRQLDEQVLRPAEEWWGGTATARRLDEKRRTQTTGETLRDPERWLGAGGAAAPSLAAMGIGAAAGAPLMPLMTAMEGGAQMRDIEGRERESGQNVGDLRAVTVAGLTGVVNGFLEKVGFERTVGRLASFLPKETRKGFLRAVSQGIQGTVVEPGTEAAQQVTSNLLVKALIDRGQKVFEGVLESVMGGGVMGGGLGVASGARRSDQVRARADRMADRRAWRAEDATGTPPAPTPFAGDVEGRRTVPQATIDAINEGVRELQSPESADRGLERLKASTAALDAQLRGLKSAAGIDTTEPRPARPPAVEPPPPQQPPHSPISIDRLLGAQALPSVVRETWMRDETAEARGRNVRQVAAREERQRLAETPGAALRMILGDDPAFAPEPARAGEPGEGRERRAASTPILDWLDRTSREIDEERRTAAPEEWSGEESRYFALTDAKLGVPNRLAYDIAERQTPDALRASIDVDGLKAFNDTFGHDLGDEYLEVLPLAAMRNGVRLFRTGGDEFRALHVGAEGDFRANLEAARKTVQSTPVNTGRETGGEDALHQGFSYGIAEDFRTADAAQYADKRARRAERAARESPPEPVGVGRSQGTEAAPRPGNPAEVPPPLRRRRGGPAGDQGAPPAGPASLPPPVSPAVPAAARPASGEPVIVTPPGGETGALGPAHAPTRTETPEPAPVDAFAGKKAGKEGEAFTADGERVGFRWRLVNVFRDLIPSHTHTETVEPNPKFPGEYQPRDRERRASKDQIEGMSKGIRPGALGESYYASEGAPIVGSDGVVESGNARSIAVQKAYRAGRMGHYLTWAEENAEGFGYTPEDVRAEGDGALFVRERTTSTPDRGELVKKFNVATVATMSAAETARADADRLTPALLNRFQPGNDGLAILAGRNRDFVASFLATVPENERSALLDEDGLLSKDGRKRIENALLGKAYGRTPVLERITESSADNTRLVSSALLNAAPTMAIVKAGMENGDIHAELDPTPAIVEAVQKLSWLRDQEEMAETYLQQEHLFGEDMSPAGKEVLRAFDEFKRSSKRMTEFLQNLADSLMLGGNARQQGIFADTSAPRLEDFVRAARRFASDGGQLSFVGGGKDLPAPRPGGPGEEGPREGGPPGTVDRPRVSFARAAPEHKADARHVLLVERYARSLVERWTDAPELVVVASEEGLPDEIRSRAQSFDAAGRLKGVYTGTRDDRVFLVAGSLRGKADVERVVLHEVMGHAGIQRLLGRERFGDVMDGIARSLREEVARKAEEYRLDLEDVEQRREAADEVLAEWATRPEAPPRAITRAMVTIRGWLRKIFPSLKWSAADVRALLSRARTRIEEGAKGTRGERAARFSRSQEDDRRTRETAEALAAEKDSRFARTSGRTAENRVYQLLLEERRRMREGAARAVESFGTMMERLEDPGDVLERRPGGPIPESSRRLEDMIARRTPEAAKLLSVPERVYQEAVRRHYALEKATRIVDPRQALPEHKDPGVLAERLGGSAGIAEEWMFGGGPFRRTADGHVERTGTPTLQEILKPLENRLRELDRYLLAARVVELAGRKPQQGALYEEAKGIVTGIDPDDARLEMDEASPEVREAGKLVNRWLDDALEYWADAGGLSPGQKKVIREMNRAYVPLYRIFEGKEAQEISRLVGPKGASAFQAEQTVKRITGGKQAVLSPLLASIDHVKRMTRAGDINIVARALVEAAEARAFEVAEEAVRGAREGSPKELADLREAAVRAAVGGIIARVPASRHVENVTPEGRRVVEAARGYGVEIDAAAAEAISALSSRRLTAGEDTIRIWRDGRLEEFRVEKSIAQSFRAMQPEDLGALRFLQIPTDIFRGGITKAPIFMVRNFARDTLDASIQSRNGFIPVLDSVIGFVEAVRDGKLRHEFLASGAGYATISESRMKGAEEILRRAAAKGRFKSTLFWTRHSLQALTMIGRPFEEAARLGEFRRARRRGKSISAAGLDAARVTVNFTVHGANPYVYAAIRLVPFLNPSIQGFDRMVRTVVSPPRGTERGSKEHLRQAALVGFHGLVGVAVPTVVLYLLNEDDEEIQDLRKTKAGALFWYVRGPSTRFGQVIIPIPKPFAWGQLFGSGTEAFLDSFKHEDPEAFRRWKRDFLESLGVKTERPLYETVFGWTPPTVQLAAGLTANRDLFFNSPIVSRGAEGLEPRYQTGPFTGATARRVGEALNYSPARIEYAARQTFGTVGREALRVSDKLLKENDGVSAPKGKLADLPLVGSAFARSPSSRTYSIEGLYKERDKAQEAMGTYRMLSRTDRVKARAFAREHAAELRAFGGLEKTVGRLADLRKAIEATRRAPDARMSPEAKATRIDALTVRMSALARQALERQERREAPR